VAYVKNVSDWLLSPYSPFHLTDDDDDDDDAKLHYYRVTGKTGYPQNAPTRGNKRHISSSTVVLKVKRS